MKILAVGAHYDDIELNCAGTLIKAFKMGAEINLVVCTDGSKGGDKNERKAEQELVNKDIGYIKVRYLGYSDGTLSHDDKLVKNLDMIIRDLEPDYIFTHSETDFHQDHVAVAKSVRSANRNAHASLITFPSQDLKYPFNANLYIDITNLFDRKLEIVKKYKSQLHRPWLQDDTLIARSIGSGVAKYVEKFHIEFLKL